jgi:glycosyltransferase involved in cell wall biosynthesis
VTRPPSFDALYPDFAEESDFVATPTPMPVTGRGIRAAVEISAHFVAKPAAAPRSPASGSPASAPGVPTIVALGPFDDHDDAMQLGAAFAAARLQCRAQLVLLGAGSHRTTVLGCGSDQGAGSSMRLATECDDDRWPDLVATADIVVLNSSSDAATLLTVLASGTPVVAPADPENVHIVVPGVVGLVYLPGDVPGMAAAMVRLLKAPELRRGMSNRAKDVARRHR